MSRHLSKLFDSLCKLKFRLDASGNPIKVGLGMYSKEDEYMDFDKECDLSGQVSLAGRGCHLVIHLSRKFLGTSFYPMHKCSYLCWGRGKSYASGGQEDNFADMVLSSHLMGIPGIKPRSLESCHKCPYPLRHLASTGGSFFHCSMGNISIFAPDRHVTGSLLPRRSFQVLGVLFKELKLSHK